MIVVFEGIDGAGKTTQMKLLVNWLEKEKGKKTKVFDFPNYVQSPFGKIIGKFLNGDFGDPLTIDPYQTAILYAGDRHYQKNEIINAVKEGEIVIINRYVPSNLAYCCAKQRMMNEQSDKQDLIKFIENLEYNLLELPRPDLVLLLDVEINTAAKQIDMKEERDYLKDSATTKDKYEASTTLQTVVKQEYVNLAYDNQLSWSLIETNNKTIEEIHANIRSILLSSGLM